MAVAVSCVQFSLQTGRKWTLTSHDNDWLTGHVMILQMSRGAVTADVSCCGSCIKSTDIWARIYQRSEHTKTA
jgi:hypothetical protein